jgi:DNA topoisomerase IB
LGNTPAVSRRSYIYPSILEESAAARLIAPERSLSLGTSGISLQNANFLVS